MSDVEVTQADREAVTAQLRAFQMGALGDGISLAERFARHRLATEHRMRQEWTRTVAAFLRDRSTVGDLIALSKEK